MKHLALLSIFLALPVILFAQQATNIYAGGFSYNNAAQPSFAGTGLYARSVGNSTYAFTSVDILPASYHPLTVTTNFGAGIAQKLFSIGSIPIYAPTSAGVSFNGSNTGWEWSTGAMASIQVSKSGWRVFPNVRVIKSNVNAGQGYQPVVGLLFGWGQ